MKWPWVSRAQADRLTAEANALARYSDGQILDLQERIIGWQKRYDDLLARYHMLKLQGFGAESIPANPTQNRIPIDPVMLAVNEACAGKDVKVRKAMLAQVKRDREATKLTDEQIIARIHRGSRPADDLVIDTTPPTPGTSATPT